MKVYNMPELNRMIEVRDDWYSCYEDNGKRYVKATLRVSRYGYIVKLCFLGKDDTGMEIEFECYTKRELYEKYKELRRFLNHIQEIKAVNLKDYLYMHGFEWA